MFGKFAQHARDFLFVDALVPYWQRRNRGTVLCLLYHRVGERGEHTFLDEGGSPIISEPELEADIQRLREWGATFGNFRLLRDGWWPTPEENGVILCFDDGFSSVYRKGLRILDRHRIPATVFQIASMLSGKRLLWEHAIFRMHEKRVLRNFAERHCSELIHPHSSDAELMEELRVRIAPATSEELTEIACAEGWSEDFAELARSLYPTEQELIDAQTSGHEIGSHGQHHYSRDAIDARGFAAELAQSAVTLAAVLGAPPQAFAFPFGVSMQGDQQICATHYQQAAVVNGVRISRPFNPLHISRCVWPGPPLNRRRWNRWLLTGQI